LQRVVTAVGSGDPIPDFQGVLAGFPCLGEPAGAGVDGPEIEQG
jgi:hypothetical protein